MSNALSQRGAFQQLVGDALAQQPAPLSPVEPPAAKKPGTQLLPTPGQHPLAAGTVAKDAAEAKKTPARTVAMQFPLKASGGQGPGSVVPSTPSPTGPGVPANAPPQSAVAQRQPPSVGQPANLPQAPSAPQPSAGVRQSAPPMGYPQLGTAAPYHVPPQPYPQAPPYGAQPAVGTGGRGWNPPPQPMMGAGYPFSYVPGTRVHVTWSNGQRYPATVAQTSGTQCLVVFPDGQQHWVEMQYLTPG